ncbi:MAG: hypothetical protein GY811_30815 [Myxococcales bacterium]|nr:hypothetical protein [Myxococcales bacterium]
MAGREGRCLDPRRTPIRVVEVRSSTGTFVAQILDFEDKGATWEITFESVGHYQFSPLGASASTDDIKLFEEAIERFDQSHFIEAEPTALERTNVVVAESQREATTWLATNSQFIAERRQLDFSGRVGSNVLVADFRRYMEQQSCWDIEAEFATQYVRNPSSGELIKGHRIVLAEMGFVTYDDKVIRDPSIFDDAWNKERRRKHIIVRLAFIRSLLGLLGHEQVVVYRGLCCDGTPTPPRNGTFVSTSFDFEIAKSCFGETDRAKTGVLYRQSVPVKRLFMTYLETAQMNQHYKEAEAVLFFDARNSVF